MLIPIAGSGTTKADVAACLGKASATSFPGSINFKLGEHFHRELRNM